MRIFKLWFSIPRHTYSTSSCEGSNNKVFRKSGHIGQVKNPDLRCRGAFAKAGEGEAEKRREGKRRRQRKRASNRRRSSKRRRKQPRKTAWRGRRRERLPDRRRREWGRSGACDKRDERARREEIDHADIWGSGQRKERDGERKWVEGDPPLLIRGQNSKLLLFSFIK